MALANQSIANDCTETVIKNPSCADPSLVMFLGHIGTSTLQIVDCCPAGQIVDVEGYCAPPGGSGPVSAQNTVFTTVSTALESGNTPFAYDLYRHLKATLRGQRGPGRRQLLLVQLVVARHPVVNPLLQQQASLVARSTSKLAYLALGSWRSFRSSFSRRSCSKDKKYLCQLNFSVLFYISL